MIIYNNIDNLGPHSYWGLWRWLVRRGIKSVLAHLSNSSLSTIDHRVFAKTEGLVELRSHCKLHNHCGRRRELIPTFISLSTMGRFQIRTTKRPSNCDHLGPNQENSYWRVPMTLIHGFVFVHKHSWTLYRHALIPEDKSDIAIVYIQSSAYSHATYSLVASLWHYSKLIMALNVIVRAGESATMVWSPTPVIPSIGLASEKRDAGVFFVTFEKNNCQLQSDLHHFLTQQRTVVIHVLIERHNSAGTDRQRGNSIKQKKGVE